MSFQDWLRIADRYLTELRGATHTEMPYTNWRAFYDANFCVYNAVRAALREYADGPVSFPV